MCTIEALKRMSEQNGNIIRLHVECLLAAGENDASQLRAMPINDSTTKFDAESKQPTSQTIPDSTRQRLYDTFQSILFLLQTNAPNVLTAGKNFLDSLRYCFKQYQISRRTGGFNYRAETEYPFLYYGNFKKQ